MPRPPIGEKAMTPAERQRRHRDIVTAKPMTKSERDDLARLIRNREKVMKSAARERSAELLAEFEQQMASIYSYDQDEILESGDGGGRCCGSRRWANHCSTLRRARHSGSFCPQRELLVAWSRRECDQRSTG